MVGNAPNFPPVGLGMFQRLTAFAVCAAFSAVQLVWYDSPTGWVAGANTDRGPTARGFANDALVHPEENQQIAGPLALMLIGFPLPSPLGPLGWARQVVGALPLKGVLKQ